MLVRVCHGDGGASTRRVQGQGDEAQVVRVFYNLLCELPLYSGKLLREVRACVALALMQACVHAVDQRISSQAILYGFPNIEQSFVDGFALSSNQYMGPPWNESERLGEC